MTDHDKWWDETKTKFNARVAKIHSAIDGLITTLNEGTGDYDNDQSIPYDKELLAVIRSHYELYD